MPLSEDQKAKLTAEANRRGVDPAALIAEAEKMLADSSASGQSTAAGQSGEPPKLFQYHLPFVRVSEVRKIWLGLDEPFPGDDEIAAEWAMKHGGGAGGNSGSPPPAA